MFESCPPKPEAMISSLRAFGYDLSMAIADLIDNSIYAKAKKICIDYDWNKGKPWIRILDDGSGMSLANLKEAMRLGSQSPLVEREPEDLGRFGLGLKTASFSQCRMLTVKTKTGKAKASLRGWDLDHVVNKKRWELSTVAPSGAARLLKGLDKIEHGTVVLWQKLDKIIKDDSDNHDEAEKAESDFITHFQTVAQYIEIVFHRFLEDKNGVKIEVGRHKCKPWDPFLISNVHTQEFGSENLDNDQLKITPYVLPHVSKRSKEESVVGGGIYGWNAHQGFYVYRNRRMIIPGGYLDFDFTPEEHFKLCRIQVDLPNNVDHDWSIDVRKATARSPSRVRRDLERIAKATRAKAVQVYRSRLGGSRQITGRNNQFNVWAKKKRGEKIIYEINAEHPVISEILLELKPSKSWVRKLFHIIEKNVPHRLIIQDNTEYEDCHVNLSPDIAKPPKELLELCRHLFTEEKEKGKSPEEAANLVCALFDEHVAYRVMLDQLVEELT